MPLGTGRFLSESAFTFPTNTTSSTGVAASAQFFAIPEPASATLLLIGGLYVLARRRRRKLFTAAKLKSG